MGRSLSHELGRLAQGIDGINGNDIVGRDVPKDRIVTYANIFFDYIPNKSEQHTARMTVGGDRLIYPDDATSPAASILETKLLLNRTISDADKGERFMTIDIKDFFLKTKMERPEYIRIHGKYSLGDMRKQYNIDNLVAADGYVYCKIK